MRVMSLISPNQGIGLAIVRNLALQYPKASLNSGPFLVYLTARDQSRGEEALRSLRRDPQLSSAGALREHGGLTDIAFHTLDISSTKSIQDFAAFLNKEHPDGIDIVCVPPSFSSSSPLMDANNPRPDAEREPQIPRSSSRRYR
ncbi:MAG: hypothetical protein LQ340_003796 [Diploschistes diacapsis]|nr:MAG: hypothetical protein LQ340_003796 [Diploschistes diacapsis]